MNTVFERDWVLCHIEITCNLIQVKFGDKRVCQGPNTVAQLCLEHQRQHQRSVQP